ncbi:hypothetical protein VTK73DRAFT_516 [Phialemonium thermophilum]|uniref:Uncharacterized protein n=1 Tax=Phialemonium thermophilum TaxID=223376 RepID=A0ABR3Y5J1_9PEZI
MVSLQLSETYLATLRYLVRSEHFLGSFPGIFLKKNPTTTSPYRSFFPHCCCRQWLHSFCLESLSPRKAGTLGAFSK